VPKVALTRLGRIGTGRFAVPIVAVDECRVLVPLYRNWVLTDGLDSGNWQAGHSSFENVLQSSQKGTKLPCSLQMCRSPGFVADLVGHIDACVGREGDES
jgi:hypothetical protein